MNPCTSNKVIYIEDMYVNHYNNNSFDEEQCRNITHCLKVCMVNVPHSVLQEIGEFATGSITECPETGCDGQIHYIHSDNFNINNVYENKFKLYDYECDNSKCSHIFHLFPCADAQCDIFAVIKRQNNNLYPNHACNLISCVSIILSNCQQIYCENHYTKNGVACVECSKYFCRDCAKDNGLFCAWNCDTFCCDGCIEEDRIKFYCKICSLMASKITRDGFQYKMSRK